MEFYSGDNPEKFDKALYRDEINLTVRAQIQVVMDALRNSNADIIDHGALADVLFVALERWERLDRLFDELEKQEAVERQEPNINPPEWSLESFNKAMQTTERIKAEVAAYYHALDTRQHGNIAAHKCFAEIQRILGMMWKPGATATTPDTVGQLGEGE